MSIKKSSNAKNLANFRQLVETIQQIDPDYKPLDTALSFENLQAAYNAAQQAVQQVSNSKALYQQAVLQRVQTYASLNKTSQRLFDSVLYLDLDTETLQTLRQSMRRIKGYVLNPQKNEYLRSTTQLAYDLRLSNFNHYIEQFANLEPYKPVHPDLDVQNLQLLANRMQTATDKVNRAATDLTQKQDARNLLFYKSKNSIAKLSKRVKSYFRSYYGTYSLPYKQIESLNINTNYQ